MPHLDYNQQRYIDRRLEEVKTKLGLDKELNDLKKTLMGSPIFKQAKALMEEYSKIEKKLAKLSNENKWLIISEYTSTVNLKSDDHLEDLIKSPRMKRFLAFKQKIQDVICFSGSNARAMKEIASLFEQFLSEQKS